MTKIKAEGDYVIVEKVDYEKEETTESGIIIKKSQVLDSSFCEAKILSMGTGIPVWDSDLKNWKHPTADYKENDIILYDARSRIGTHADFDVIKREDIVAVVYDETD